MTDIEVLNRNTDMPLPQLPEKNRHDWRWFGDAALKALGMYVLLSFTVDKVAEVYQMWGATDKQMTTLEGFDPAVANSAALEVEIRCSTTGNVGVIWGTAGLYDDEGVLKIGTVEHVTQKGLPDNCEFHVNIGNTKSAAGIQIDMQAADFVNTADDELDQMSGNGIDDFVMAPVLNRDLGTIEKLIDSGQLHPLHLSNRQAEGGNLVLVQRASAAPLITDGGIQGLEMHETKSSGSIIGFDIDKGTSCHGDSGSPLIVRNADGSYTDQVVGVLTATRSPFLPCARRGFGVITVQQSK